jgi:hypothetical protein
MGAGVKAAGCEDEHSPSSSTENRVLCLLRVSSYNRDEDILPQTFCTHSKVSVISEKAAGNRFPKALPVLSSQSSKFLHVVQN